MTEPVPSRQGAAAGPPPIDAVRLDTVRETLLTWFGANRRDLPWRHTRDPYRILVSEVMLQQIQGKRAIPFYEAFLDRFPTIGELAAAPLAEAIRVWGDLGRYRRVVALHRTARTIVTEHGGIVPSDPATLRLLPGIGPYTAGAIACFAYDQDTAFVDTNMRRVLHRVFVGVDVPGPSAREAEVQAIAAGALPRGRAWDWNQGLMDFGSRVCTARRPACAGCPLRDSCRAYPAIGPAIAALPRSGVATRPVYRYEESDRFYRGRVLAQLRDAAIEEPGIPLDELGRRVRADFSPADVPWLARVVESLRKDGLAVAEERPAYDAGAESDDPSPDQVRVKLPS